VPTASVRDLIRRRLADETGRIEKDAPRRVALTYPSPYAVAMSSLGYQRIYRAIQAAEGVCAERVFLDDGADRPGARPERPVSYESLRPLDEFDVVAFSVAYETELAGLVRMLDAAGLPLWRAERDRRHPFLLAGGPLTNSNPLPLAPFCDAVVMGEGEELIEPVLTAIAEASSRADALARLARLDHVFVPELHGSTLPPIARAGDALLPATSAIVTPHAELSSMFLIEAERGCSRGCTYCVMRRSTNGGMRIVPKDVLLDKIPPGARRVGLVGAAVSDHPKIVEIVDALARRGAEVGLSSLRPDKLKDDFVRALKAAGYRTLTTALDGPSERMRSIIERRGREQHFVTAAENVRKHGMDRLKLYLMIGLPGETDEDIDECSRFVGELSRRVPVVLGISPFCSKRNTPLDHLPYAGVPLVQARLERLRSGLKGRADVRATSAKWTWVEYVLAQGGEAEGAAVAEAVRAGGRYADFRRAFSELGHSPNGEGYLDARAPLAPERMKRRRLGVVAS
jgi:radical SAM superfamily enzyme YgiQ (UPF0313 family)